ncbi:MAG: gliding motility lipoprotein GldJ [Bacteroidia bacterium]|nr:gliding motility lipoprotein GldJ [Bacteroidia bacterium]
MEIRKITGKALFLAGLLALTACNKETSPVTGWAYNDPDNGGFQVLPYTEQETGPGLVLVEGGRFTFGRTEQDVLYDWSNIPRTVTVSSFYMDETEVRNLDYLEYLWWLSRVFGTDDVFKQIYVKALPDTLAWREKLGYNEPYVEYYLRHPSYRDYPVVGVNWMQANDFCSWRTDRVNEYILVREGILDWDPNANGANNFNTDAYLAGKYEGNVKKLIPKPDGSERKVRMEDGIFLPKYRLPTEAEWEYAALGLIGNMSPDYIIKERKLYPWNGQGVRNPEEKFIGDFMGNFKRDRGDNMGIAGYLNDAADITAPVFSYWPNDYGLYNMGGNVSEWVLDTYRTLSPEDMDDFRPFRGNVFKTALKDSTDGTIMVDDGTLLVDSSGFLLTDADGNILSKPGAVMMRNVDIKYKEDRLDERRNYKYSDNINYLDGDHKNSSIFYYADNPGDNYLMYQYPVPANKIQNQRDDLGQNGLINNKSKVYKGGSWKDRAYWMVPGTRRFLDQQQSASWLGFRCAMDRVGSPVGLGNKRAR